MPLSRENTVNIIGTIESNNPVIANSPKAGDYIRGDLVVKVNMPKEMSIPLQYFCGVVTKDNKPRKLYKQLVDLKVGSKINLTGKIEDNKFWDVTRGQLVKTKRLSIVFINPVKVEDKDKAEFTYSGFVVEALKEKLNSEEKLVNYVIKLGQSDYKESRAEIVDFVIDPKDTKAVRFIEREYTSGKTVKISGVLDFDVRTETRTEEVDFGQPIVKTYQRNISNLVITSGLAVSENVYEKANIEELLGGDAAHDRQVEEDAKNKEASGTTSPVNKPLTSTSGTNQSLL